MSDIPWWRKHPTLPDEEQRCGNCRYYSRPYVDHEVNVIGTCVRLPGRVVEGDDICGVFPEMVDCCWCGEWGSREKFVWPKNSLGGFIKAAFRTPDQPEARNTPKVDPL